MNRSELRFRVLLEYYKDMHAEHIEKNATMRVQKMDPPRSEINAAKLWLIESDYVIGSPIPYAGSSIPMGSITRINNHGVDYVESVMDEVFTQLPEKFSNIKKLSKTEQINQFTEKCLDHPIGKEICRIAFDAIIKYVSGG